MIVLNTIAYETTSSYLYFPTIPCSAFGKNMEVRKSSSGCDRVAVRALRFRLHSDFNNALSRAQKGSGIFRGTRCQLPDNFSKRLPLLPLPWLNSVLAFLVRARIAICTLRFGLQEPFVAKDAIDLEACQRPRPKWHDRQCFLSHLLPVRFANGPRLSLTLFRHESVLPWL